MELAEQEEQVQVATVAGRGEAEALLLVQKVLTVLVRSKYTVRLASEIQ